VTRGQLPQRAGSVGLNGGGAAAAVKGGCDHCIQAGLVPHVRGCFRPNGFSVLNSPTNGQRQMDGCNA